MSGSLCEKIEFQCQQCRVWFASPISLSEDSLKLLHGLNYRCPHCFKCFVLEEEKVRFSNQKGNYRCHQNNHYPINYQINRLNG